MNNQLKLFQNPLDRHFIVPTIYFFYDFTVNILFYDALKILLKGRQLICQMNYCFAYFDITKSEEKCYPIEVLYLLNVS
jgi:hypothetical protein